MKAGLLLNTILFVILGLTDVQAADKVIKLRLGTLAPAGTSYHKSLQVMGEQWRKTTDGGVQLTIFPGGSQGSEADMVGLMQTGNLDAGLMTAGGLWQIEPSALALQIMPMQFRSLEEVEVVAEKLRPQLESRLLAKGYVVLFWSDSGWVRFFSKAPVVHPDDLRKLKVFTDASSTQQYDLWKNSGFSPVALESTAIPQGLLSGTISAVPTVPIFALAAQLDGQAKYMLELNWAPMVGAAVVRKKAWDRIPAEKRDALLAIAAEAGRQVRAAGRAESDAAVAAMVKRGLHVQKVSPEVNAEWVDVIEKIRDHVRGKIVPADMFDAAQQALKEFRSRPGAAQK